MHKAGISQQTWPEIIYFFWNFAEKQALSVDFSLFLRRFDRRLYKPEKCAFLMFLPLFFLFKKAKETCLLKPACSFWRRLTKF